MNTTALAPTYPPRQRPAHLRRAHEYTLTRDVVLYAGPHAKVVKAGTVVLARVLPDAVRRNSAVYVYAPGESGSFRLSGVVYAGALQPPVVTP